MSLPQCMIAAFVIITRITSANELGATLDSLASNHGKLEGYQATYEAKTSTGKTGQIEIGVDFKSGWSYLISELKDERGNLTQKGQQWTTGEGLYLIQSGDRTVLFEGFHDLGKRFDTLTRVIKGNDKIIPSRVSPFAYLDANGINMGTGHSSEGLSILSKARKVVSKAKQSVTLELGPLGTVIMDANSGTILSQTIKSEQITRTFQRTHWSPNPGKDAIAKRLKIDLKKALQQDLGQSGMSQKFTHQILQKIINSASQNEKVAKELPSYLTEIEDGFVDFLKEEPLNRSGFVKNQFLFVLLDQAMAKASAKFKKDDKKIGATEILTNPKTRSDFTKALSSTLRRQAPPAKKEQYLREVLRARLTGDSGPALTARQQVEAMVEQAYYRVRLGRAIDAYVAQLKDK